MDALALIILALSVSIARGVYCPDRTATFTTYRDEVVNAATSTTELYSADVDLTFFKNDLGFRDGDIELAFDNALKFFNETYGLDFPKLQPNAQIFFENAYMIPLRFRENANVSVFLSNWLQTGSTRVTCRSVLDGGYVVGFTAQQLLRGSYGGPDGIGINEQGSLLYGFSKINVCEQSPLIIQIQTATPFRLAPIDNTFFINFDAYSTVLGRGKGMGSSTTRPEPNNPGKVRFTSRIAYTFPDE